jgi:PHD/YefM family antitoxin component YafN of YafNO toxin-antitoxin module
MEKTITLTDIYLQLKKMEQAMATKEELESALETMSVLSNEETMQQIKESEKDIKSGKITGVNSVEDL